MSGAYRIQSGRRQRSPILQSENSSNIGIKSTTGVNSHQDHRYRYPQDVEYQVRNGLSFGNYQFHIEPLYHCDACYMNVSALDKNWLDGTNLALVEQCVRSAKKRKRIHATLQWAVLINVERGKKA
jgi:hypothetical protein